MRLDTNIIALVIGGVLGLLLVVDTRTRFMLPQSVTFLLWGFFLMSVVSWGCFDLSDMLRNPAEHLQHHSKEPVNPATEARKEDTSNHAQN